MTPLMAYISASITIGTDDLSAKGGVTSFESEEPVPFSGWALNTLIFLGDPNENPLFIAGDIHSHIYLTTDKETTKGSGSNKNTESTTEFTRLKADAAAYYNIGKHIGFPSTRVIGLGVGFGYTRLPIMRIKSAANSVSSPVDQAFTGTLISLGYHDVITESVELDAFVNYVPIAF